MQNVFWNPCKKGQVPVEGFSGGGGRLFLEIFRTTSLPAENWCPTWRWKWFCCSCPFNFVPRTVRCPLCARMMCCNCLREWFVPSSRVAWLASFFWVSYATHHRNHSFKRWMTTSGMTTRVPLYLWSLSPQKEILQVSFLKVEVDVGYLGLKGWMCLHH